MFQGRRKCIYTRECISKIKSHTTANEKIIGIGKFDPQQCSQIKKIGVVPNSRATLVFNFNSSVGVQIDKDDYLGAQKEPKR